jgi:hypothetical protein
MKNIGSPELMIFVNIDKATVKMKINGLCYEMHILYCFLFKLLELKLFVEAKICVTF